MSTHLDADGNVHMVDVTAKPETFRTAVVQGAIRMSRATAESIQEGPIKKGDVLQVARIAGIQAAKQTSTLIPLCHTILIEAVNVEFHWSKNASAAESWNELICRVKVQTTARTGVEMEAMTAATVALLTVYDMAKSMDRAMEVRSVRLLEKSGGKSGDFGVNLS